MSQLQDHHLDWVHKFTGVNPRKGPSGGGSAVLAAEPAAGSDKQSQDFKAAFHPILAVIDGHLAFTAEHAEDAAHAEKTKARAALVGAYGGGLRQIDPADEAKAKPAIDKVLESARALQNDVGAFRASVEKDFNDWQSRAEKFTAAIKQVAEMEDWGHPQADALQVSAAAVRDAAESRKYAEAARLCDTFLSALQPAYADYTAQKAAQERYDPALKLLQPKMDDVRKSPFKKLVPYLQDVTTVETQMKAAVDAHDYLKAEPILADLTGKVGQCITMRDDLAEKKDKFDKARAALESRIPKTSEPGGEHIVSLQQEITAKVPVMDGDATAEDFDAALTLATEIDGKITELEAALAARKNYEGQLSTLKAKVPEPTNAAPLKGLEDEIQNLLLQAEAEAAKDAYEQACAYLTQLESTLADYMTAVTKFKEQKAAYERAKATLEPRLPKSSEASEGRIAEVQTEIQTSWSDAKAAAAAEDYAKALDSMNALEAQLDEFEKLLAARAKYDAKRKEVEANLPQSDQKAVGPVADMLKQIEQLLADADTAAKASDYDPAIDDLNQIAPILPKYQDLVNLRGQFEKRWAEVQPKVPGSTDPDTSPSMQKIVDAIGQSRTAIEAVASTTGDYEGGLAEIDKLLKLVADLAEAKEKAAQARASFEQNYAALKPNVESALATKADIPEIKAKQDDLAAKKKTLDDTVAKNDFETADTQLADVKSALDAYFDELGKSAVDRNLVRDIAGKLTTAIMGRYMTASAKIDRAASAYDAAIAEHKGAIAKVDAKKQLVAELAAGVFFAAAGGFAGGVAANIASSPIKKAFENLATTQAGIIDATKDVAKYVVRTADKIRGKFEDPTVIVAKIGKNGTELARGVGAAINDQGAKLLKAIEQWYDVLIEADTSSPSGGTVRVNLKDGDPYASVVGDPFLKILEDIRGTKIDFARALWAVWIEHNAYEVEQACSKSGCRAVVGDNAEGFFASWEHLTASIQEQTGDDFGLRKRLDEARKVVQQEVDERNAHGGVTHDPVF